MLNITNFDRAFPFALVLGPDLTITRIGPSLRTACGDVREQERLEQKFVLERPESPMTFDGEWLRQHLGQLCVLRHRASGLQLRGQWLAADQPAAGFLFLGSPWLTHPDELVRFDLQVADFAINDSMIDLLQMAQAQQMALDDVKQLAARLTGQRAELRAANQRLAEQNAALLATDRRLREQEAEARKLALVAARTTNPVVVTDASGRIEWVNHAFTQLTGYTPEEARGRTPGSLLQGPLTDRATVEEVRSLIQQGQGFEKEILNYDKAGRPYVVHIEVQPIRDEQGRIMNFMAIQNDVTERVRNDVRRELSDTVSRLLATTDSLAGGLEGTLEAIARALRFEVGLCWTLRRDGLVLEKRHEWTAGAAAQREFAAQSACFTFRRGEGLPGRVWQSGAAHWIKNVAHDENFPRAAAAARANLVRALALPIFIAGEVGGVMEFFGSAHYLPDPELPDFLQALGRQIGQFVARMQAVDALHEAVQAAEAANRAKSDFLASVSHEIRTPMNAVMGMTGLLRETRLDARQIEFVEAVRTASESLLEIIDDILDFAKIESRKLSIEANDCDLPLLIGGILDLLAPRAHDKGLEITAIFAPDVPTGVRTDEGRLRQILVNLLGNGIKFTQQGRVVLRVERVAEADPTADVASTSGGPHLRFTVSDTGLGIAPEQQQAVFEPFVQADNTSSRRFGGTGLGLAISRRLVELLGGRIGLSSRLGEGSAFWFTLPLLPVVHPPVPLHDAALIRARVLLVDADELARESLCSLVHPWGLRLECAARVEEAQTLLAQATAQSDPFQVVLIDNRNLGDTGARIAHQLTAAMGRFQARFILLTRTNEIETGASPGRVNESRMAKPLKSAALFNALLSAISGRVETSARTGETEPERPANAGLRILVVEDREINQRFAYHLLKRLGYRADFAANGQQAVEVVQRVAYDVIIMDCQMPVMDGYEATRRIRHLESQGGTAARGRARIVAMTASAIPENRQRCLAAGMDDFVTKPVRLDEVRDLLASCTPTVPRATGKSESDVGGGEEAGAPRASDPATATENLESSLALLQSELGSSAAVEMLTLFLRDTPQRCADLQLLLSRADWNGLMRGAHMLAGSAGIIGLARLREACLQLEDEARGLHRPDELARQLEAIGRERIAMLPALERSLHRLAAAAPAAAAD